MLEQLIAWAGDCQVRGLVDLGDGRLSDLINDSETITFQSATLRALDDGHEVDLDKVEVGRQELHLIEVSAAAGIRSAGGAPSRSASPYAALHAASRR